MSDRVRVVLILATVVLLAGGGGYYFFKVYRPAQDLKNAQAEIAGWETRFAGARDCLLGTSPGSSKTSEALAIREMAPDPWDRGRCTPLISKLNRGEAPDTGIPAIETAWNELDKAAQKAAIAFARHVSEPTTLENDPLPGALDALDEARNKLRTTARMAATETSGAPLPAVTTLPISDGVDAVTSLVVDAVPSAHGLVLFGKTDNRMVQVTVTAGGTPKAMRVGPGSLRGVPDMTWGATATSDDEGRGQVRAGAMNEEGVIQEVKSPTGLASTEVAITPQTLAAVVGSYAGGYVVFGDLKQLTILRSKGGGMFDARSIPIEIADAGVDVDGRVAIVWGTKDKMQGQILKPGGTEEPIVELPALGTLCLTKDRVWGHHGQNAVSFGAGRPVFTKQIGYASLQGCTPDAAVFHDRAEPEQVVICTDDCRTARIPSGAPETATTTVVGGKLVALASHGGVLGVWREGTQPTFYALPEAARPAYSHGWPAMALTDGKVIDVLARGEDSYVVLRVPAG